MPGTAGQWIRAPPVPDLRRPTSGLTIELWLNVSVLSKDSTAPLFDCRNVSTKVGMALLRSGGHADAAVELVLNGSHLIHANSDAGTLSSPSDEDGLHQHHLLVSAPSIVLRCNPQSALQATTE